MILNHFPVTVPLVKFISLVRHDQSRADDREKQGKELIK